MNLFSNDDPYNGTCDICGAILDPEDFSIHLCKACQQQQFEEWQNR